MKIKRNNIFNLKELFRAGDRVRTGDIQLGRLTLYQLSYSRVLNPELHIQNYGFTCNILMNSKPHRGSRFPPLQECCGESRIRTCEDVVSRFTVCPRWPLEYLPFF